MILTSQNKHYPNIDLYVKSLQINIVILLEVTSDIFKVFNPKSTDVFEGYLMEGMFFIILSINYDCLIPSLFYMHF